MFTAKINTISLALNIIISFRAE